MPQYFERGLVYMSEEHKFGVGMQVKGGVYA